MIRIERVVIYTGQVDYHESIAGTTYERFDMAVIELVAGRESGWGEVCMVDPAACLPILKDMAGELVGRPLSGPAAALDDVHENRPHGARRASREGLSMAVYDLFGRALNVPVSVLLGGARRREVPAMPCVTLGPHDAMELRARKWVEAGYRHLKIKFTGRPEEDLEVTARIRRAVGPDVELMIDANSSCRDFDTAVRLVEALEPFGVTVVEDIYDGPLDDLRRLRERIKPRLMVDRHAYWPNVFEVLRQGAADAINLHPRNEGGLDISLRIEALARAAGVETRIGAAHILGIGSAAFQILGSVIALTMPVEDLGPLRFESHFGASLPGYEADARRMILKEQFPVKDGCILIPDRPGLGIDVDRKKLERITQDVVEMR